MTAALFIGFIALAILIVRLVEREFRRFFLLMARDPKRLYGLHNGPVDDFWHELICCTSLYRDYCQTVAGRFVHHDPRSGSAAHYARTWWTYQEVFGEIPDLVYWPAPDPAHQRRPDGDSGGCGGVACSDGGSHGGCCGHGCGGGSGCGGGCGGGS